MALSSQRIDAVGVVLVGGKTMISTILWIVSTIAATLVKPSPAASGPQNPWGMMG